VLEEWEQQAAKLGRPIGVVDDDEHTAHMKFFQERRVDTFNKWYFNQLTQ